MVLDQIATTDGDRRYHIVAPPGAGKTIVGLELIRRWSQPAVVFAPTATIQEQWRDKLALFTPPGFELESVASLNPARLALINVFTYQLISSPGQADDILRQLAVERWTQDLIASRHVPSEAAAADRIAKLQANNPEAYHAEVSHRVPRIKREALRDDHQDVRRFLHPNALQLISNLVSHGVKTVVLDECHHLLDYWAIVLRVLIAEISEPRIVGLTATLPDPHDLYSYENYTSLLGDVDFEIPTPAVVKDGELAPYRELACIVKPSPKELEYLATVQQVFESSVAETTDSRSFRDWVIQLVAGTADAWPSLLANDAPLAVACVRFLRLYGIDLPAGVVPPTDLLHGNEAQPTIDDWLMLLERYSLDVLKTSADPADHNRLAMLRRVLHPFGLALTEEGLRHSRSVGDLVLAFSEAKDAAVVRILVAEDAALGTRLRAVVVTDFEHDRRGLVEVHDALDKDAGSARRLFRRLALEGTLTHLNPILVTGEVLWIEAAASEQIVAACNEFLKEQRLGASCSTRLTRDPHVAEVLGEGPAWSPRTYVHMVTSLFGSGLTRCLIGTRGLLGEGWDAECLNTLIDLTAVTTSTSVQQLRGRGLRLDPSWPRKVTHNWDVVTVAPEFERGDTDLQRFLRRHDQLWGVADNGKVVRGIGHVDRKLSSELAFHSFKAVDYANLDERMMDSLSTRENEYAVWRVGEEYSNFAWSSAGISAPDMRVRTVNTIQDTLRRLIIQFWPAVLTAAVGALVLTFQVGARASIAWRQPLEFLLIGLGFTLLLALAAAMRQGSRIMRQLLVEQPTDAILLDIARALLVALSDSQCLSGHLTIDYVRVVAQDDGSYQVFVDYASEHDAATFTQAYRQVFEPIRDQRYLILRDDGRLPHVWLMPLWLALRPWARRAAGYPPAFYPVPQVLAGRKERAQAYAAAWRKFVGGGELIYTRSPEGFRLLVEAQARRRPVVSSTAFEEWR